MLQFTNIYSGMDLLIVAVAYLLVILLSLSLHEFGHAYVATKQGDITPKAQGRLTLNPLKHFDPVGFLLIFFVGFGWAKPVQVNPLRYRNYKKGMFLVAIAGVSVNLILAFISYPLYMLITMYGATLPVNLELFLNTFLYMMVVINLVLIVFNLLPISPLDGFRVVETFAKYNNKYVRFMQQYGAFILMGVLIILQYFNFLSVFTALLAYPINLFWSFIFGLFL